VLGVAHGVVDLRTGLLAPGDPEDRITRVAAVDYNPDSTCPRWEQFILDISNDDPQVAAFIARSIGYALTGMTTEQVFWILYGVGANGKSTLLETITRHVIPAHSWTMSFPVHTWSESLSEYQRAELVGRRLVIAKESEQEKRLNTEFVKSLTGTDTINARHPYGRPFQFVPQAKFILACNHQPIIRDDTRGMWRRVRLVPFTRTFTVNPDYGDDLAAEAEGILAWAVRGCLDWQRDGLQAPEAVLQATNEYQRDSDTLSRFIDAQCLMSPHARVRAGELFAAYEQWCDRERIGDDRLSLRAFGERMKAMHPPLPHQRRVTYSGIGLQAEEEMCGG
jgi:putative DNA primase/helicase